MYPFWEMVIAPLVKAAGAQRVLEVGALRGETTAKMFDQLGPTAELHVIDPLPQFDPDEHARAFPGRYVFHRALSLEVLGDLPPFDVALIDGDHNWYTVYHELKALDATSREARRPLPLLALHDVAWPYGHRDLYYEPSQIPEEHRQPHARAGLAPGYHHVLPEGGFNADLHNAVDGGGPRNGVRRALEDFLEEHDRPYRHVHLPFYYGLSIVVEEERLARTPEVGRLLDSLEGGAGRLRLLKLSERIRIDEQVHVHNWNRVLERRTDVQRRRYLDLLKTSLLALPHLENEVRLDYLARLPAGSAPDADKLRDPYRTLWVRYKRILQDREAGRPSEQAPDAVSFPYTDMGRAALDHLEEVVAGLAADTVAGDLVECGAGRGGGGVLMKAVLGSHFVHDRRVWVVDPFVASEPRADAAAGGDLAARLARFRADLSQVRDAYERFDLLDDDVRFVQGDYADALADAAIERIAVLRVGRSAGADLAAILPALLPRVSPGGTVILEGVGSPAVRAAVDRVRASLGVTDHMVRVGWDTVTWTVGTPPPAAEEAAPAGGRRRGRRVAPRRIAPVPPAPSEPVDLSVVVVFYNMRREAARTLHSLSRSYQRGVEGLTYEVIAVENGSDPDQRLTAAEVAAHGREFRLLDLAEQSTPSPTVALNRGIADARGENLALMIDGAHVLTPGVFHNAMTALAAYEPAVVATQQWYVGPGQQPDAQLTGYDQAVEDRLFRQIGWPVDGYRLFEIGHFIGDRDWFDGIIESNCLVVPRKILEQVGAFDDGFDMPGGGYTNLELFERLHTHPGVTPTSILGEGSFHQFHGGTTTNVADEADRRNRIVSYREHFVEARGRGLQGLNKPVHYVGAMDTKAARRTRSRRELLMTFRADRDPVTTTEARPMPVPEEVKLAAIEAIWENQAWRDATWLGHPVNRFPTDLQTVQEILSEVRPSTVVLLGDDDGLAGRALHAASVLDQLGQGQVVAVGAGPAAERATHPRVTHLEGAAEAPEVVAEVTRLVGDGDALAIIALGAVERVTAAFEAYQALVPVDGYVVVENTVVNGRPSESGFGPGPHEAVNELLQRHRDFVPDVRREHYTLTFNKGGYLRRVAAP